MESDIKRIGIAVDNYKLRKFKRKLSSSGFLDMEVKQLMPGVSVIFFQAPERDIPTIGKICKKLQIDFKQSN